MIDKITDELANDFEHCIYDAMMSNDVKFLIDNDKLIYDFLMLDNDVETYNAIKTFIANNHKLN